MFFAKNDCKINLTHKLSVYKRNYQTYVSFLNHQKRQLSWLCKTRKCSKACGTRWVI